MRTKLFLFLIFTTLAVLFLGGCIFGDDNGNDPNGNLPTEDLFDISKLNYNPSYQNPDNTAEKGFILYDKIDFNLITFSKSYSSSPYFVVTQDGGATLAEIRKSTQEGYPEYEILSSGTLKVAVHIPNVNSTKAGEFTVKVSAGGYPTHIAFEFFGDDGAKITELTGGTEVKIKANVYSDNVVLAEDGDVFTSGWYSIFVEGKPLHTHTDFDGVRMAEVALPNLTATSTISCVYRYRLTAQQTDFQKVYAFEVSDNLDKLVLDWGLEENGGIISMPYDFSGLISKAKAHYLFTNGDTMPLQVKSRSDSKDGDLVPFIKYSGEDSFENYTGSTFDYSSSINGHEGDIVTRYVSNGVNYYFNPSKTSAEVYLAHRYSEKITGGTVARYRKEDDSEINLNFTKSAPDAIDVTKITGSELQHTEFSGVKGEKYVTFERELVDKAVSAMVFVGGTKKTTATTNNQHFIPTVVVTGQSSFKDYYFRYNWKKVQRLNNGNFYGENEGKATIEVISCHSPEVNFSFEVDLQNPVIETEIKYLQTINLYLTFDPTPYVQVNETLYNYNTINRSVAENEELKYFYTTYLGDGGITELAASYFTHKNSMYTNTNHDIRLYRNGNQVSKNALAIKCYISPDYYIQIDGTKYLMSEMEDKKYESNNDFNSDVPYLEIVGSRNSLKLFTKDTSGEYIEVSTDDAYITAAYPLKDIYYVTYKNFKSGKEARICAIKLLSS